MFYYYFKVATINKKLNKVLIITTRMKTIILDTNVLMALGQFRLDIFSELARICDFKYEVKVLAGTIAELNKIINQQKGKHKFNAKLALDIIKKKNIKVMVRAIVGDTTVDDLLVKEVKQGAIIVTQDQILKKRINKLGGQLIVIRQKKKLVWA